MIQKDGVDIEMLPDDWKRTGHVIQTRDFFAKKVFSCYARIINKCANKVNLFFCRIILVFEKSA